MFDSDKISRRNALRTIGAGASAQLSIGLAAGKTREREHRLGFDEINEEVQKEWQSIMRRHGKIVDTEHAASGKNGKTYSSKRLSSAMESRNNDQSVMIQRLKFEDGYTAKVMTAIDRDIRSNGGKFIKKIDNRRFKTVLSSGDVKTLEQNQQEARASRDSIKDADFAASSNPSEQHSVRLSESASLSIASNSYDFSATEAEDGDSAENCLGPCVAQGVNWATDVDEADNRCGVSVLDAVVSIEANAYAEVYTLFDNDVKTGDFDITFDGYTRGTVSSLGMAAGVEFLGFVRNLDNDVTDAVSLGTLDSTWYDYLETIDAQWGPGDGAGPGDDAPYTDYEFSPELNEGDTYALGIRMEVDLANLSLPGAITINFTDTDNPLDEDFGMAYNVIGVDW
jgi:hypothetical protein